MTLSSVALSSCRPQPLVRWIAFQKNWLRTASKSSATLTKAPNRWVFTSMFQFMRVHVQSGLEIGLVVLKQLITMVFFTTNSSWTIKQKKLRLMGLTDRQLLLQASDFRKCVAVDYYKSEIYNGNSLDTFWLKNFILWHQGLICSSIFPTGESHDGLHRGEAWISFS